MRLRNVIIGTAIALVAATTATMSLDIAIKSHQRGSSACPHDNELRTYQQWRQTLTFPFTAPTEKFQRVKDKYNLVGVGSSKHDVVQAFGPPDFEEEIIPKEPWRSCIGYDFLYYFEKPDGEIDNEIKDKRIEVFFSIDGRANWIVGNVGLPEKGGYAVRP